MAQSNWTAESGFSVIEVLAATTILTVGLVALAQVCAISATANGSSRATTFASILAGEKMEQLRELTWGFDALGLPVSDVATDTAVVPESPGGGTGLRPSPAGSLQHDTAGYVDYLDANGQSLGGSLVMLRAAVYIRRWSIEPLPTSPDRTLVLQVLVTRNKNRWAADARIVSVKTRKGA